MVSLPGLGGAVAVASRFAARQPNAAGGEQRAQEQKNDSISRRSVRREEREEAVSFPLAARQLSAAVRAWLSLLVWTPLPPGGLCEGPPRKHRV
jgi:hypothetical protein